MGPSTKSGIVITLWSLEWMARRNCLLIAIIETRVISEDGGYWDYPE